MSATADLTNKIILAVVDEFPGSRLWRANVGRAVPVSAVQEAVRLIRQGKLRAAETALSYGRGVSFGVIGQADITGILAPGGKRLEIEVKTGSDKPSDQQLRFAAMIRAAGGIYVVARSVDDAIEGVRSAP